MFDHLASVYGVRVFDYGDDRGAGLLVASGSGLMLSVMDAAPRLRWCLDIDALRIPPITFADWLRCASHVTETIAVAAWFAVSQHDALLEGLRALRRRGPTYVQWGKPLPDPFVGLRTVDTLGGLIESLR